MIVLKAGSNPPSNQMVTLDGALGTVQPTLGSERTGNAWLQLFVGIAVRIVAAATIAMKQAINFLFLCRTDSSPWCPGKNVGPDIVDKKVDKSSDASVFTRELIHRHLGF